MSGETEQWASTGWYRHARDFIRASHRHLPMLRPFLPFRDPDQGAGSDIVRWSDLVDLQQGSASVDWFEATAAVADADPSVRRLVSSMGEVDADTSAGLRTAIGALPLRGLRWIGYGDSFSAPRTRIFGEDYFETGLTGSDLATEQRLPDFAWDAEGRLAWGGRLYPDSLIIAAELPIFRRLHLDTRLDTVTVRADTDALPPSAGD